MKYIVGIDVGVTGAMAFVNPFDKTDYLVFDLPVIVTEKAGKKRRVIDFEALADIFVRYQDDILAIYVEAVHPMHTNGSIACFKLGQSFGGVVGVITALRFNLKLVSPQKWKRKFDLLKKDKNAALDLAREKYGRMHLLRAKDHNRGEALLIAEYGLTGGE